MIQRVRLLIQNKIGLNRLLIRHSYWKLILTRVSLGTDPLWLTRTGLDLNAYTLVSAARIKPVSNYTGAYILEATRSCPGLVANCCQARRRVRAHAQNRFDPRFDLVCRLANLVR